MRKVSSSRDKQIHQPSVAGFVAELEARLRRELPEVDANVIAAETEAHFADRVDDLVSAGRSRQIAERLAIVKFGDPRVYARNLTDGFFASRSTLRAYRAGRSLCSLSFLLLLTVAALGPPLVYAVFNIPGLAEAIVLSAVFLVPVLTVIFAFQARRPQTKLIIVYCLTLTLVKFVSAVLYDPTAEPSSCGPQRRKKLGYVPGQGIG